MSQQTGQRYWFRARRRGKGWGLPSSAAGWTFFLAWFAVLALISRHFLPGRPLAFVLLLGLWGLIYVIVCYAKGEPWPPREDGRG